MAKRHRKRRYPQKHRKFLDEHRHLYDSLLAQEGGGCAICGEPPKNRRLALDHDHQRMVLRSVLCFRCNRNLPTYATADWLEKAAAYLRRYE